METAGGQKGVAVSRGGDSGGEGDGGLIVTLPDKVFAVVISDAISILADSLPRLLHNLADLLLSRWVGGITDLIQVSRNVKVVSVSERHWLLKHLQTSVTSVYCIHSNTCKPVSHLYTVHRKSGIISGRNI